MRTRTPTPWRHQAAIISHLSPAQHRALLDLRNCGRLEVTSTGRRWPEMGHLSPPTIRRDTLDKLCHFGLAHWIDKTKADDWPPIALGFWRISASGRRTLDALPPA